MATAPLQGVRVVDLGIGEAAGLAATLLCDLGAAGVRAGPCGDASAHGAVIERGRWAAADATEAQLLRWISRADVLIDDGALGERGLQIGALGADNPGLVILEVSDRRGAVPVGRSGAAAGALAGVYAPPLSRTPRWTPLPVVSTLAGLTGACGVVAALIARQRDGRGQVVRAPLHEAGFAAVETLLALSDRAPSAWHGLQWAASPFVGPYRCADGRWLMVHFGLRAHVDRLLVVLAAQGMVRAAAELKRTMTAQTRADPSAVGSPGEAGRIRTALVELFGGLPAERWEALLGEGGLCAAVCRTGPEWRASAQAREGGHVIELMDPVLGPTLQPGPWVCCGQDGPRPRRVGRPSWGVRDSAVRADPDPRPPLAGVRVLDLTQVIAGPVAGRLLAELGAEVVRVERPDFQPAWSEAFHVVFNPGKASCSASIQTPADGRALLEAVQPDVVVHNWREGVAERLGLDLAGVRAVRPGAVVLQLNAYGQAGPWSGLPGWEQTAQAASGMQLDYGDGVPELVPLPINDEATGLAGALGALAGLYARGVGRSGSGVHTSLAASATWLQRQWLFGPAGRPARGERGPSLGAGALRRFTRASDGWMWLEAEADALGAVSGLEAIDGEDSQAVDRALAAEPVATWVARATPVRGVVIAPWRSMAAAVWDSSANVRRCEHVGLGPVTRVDPGLHLGRTPTRPLGAAALRGADGPRWLAGTGLQIGPAEVPRSRKPGARAVRRLWWAASAVRWGAFVVGTRLAPIALGLALVGCGGSTGPAEPLVQPDRPFLPLGESDVSPGPSLGSNVGLGLSGSASPIADLGLDRDDQGQLRVWWGSEGTLRLRSWDGQRWSDRAVSSRGEGRNRARTWEIGVGPAGVVTLGVDLPDVERIAAPELRAVLGGTEQLWTGPVDGLWAWDPKGRLVIALFAGPDVQVHRWDGEAWTGLGDTSAPRGYRAGKRLGPAVAFDKAGEPVVAWREPYTVPPVKGGADLFKSTRWRTIVRRWTGASWKVLAGDDSPLDEDPSERYPQSAPGEERNKRAEWEAAQDAAPRVAVQADDTVVVAWDTLDGVQVWRRSGEAWVAMPNPVNLRGEAQDVDLIPDGEAVAIAWSHTWRSKARRHPREVQVRRWEDGAWVAPGSPGPAGASNTLGPSARPRLAAHEGSLAVAWVDTTSGSPEVLLSWFDGTSWVGLPDGGRSGGLGSADHMSSTPALTAMGGPVVSWVEEVEPGVPPGRALIRTARWTADGWLASKDLALPVRPFQLQLEAGGGGIFALWDQRSGSAAKGLFVGELSETGWVRVGPARGLVKDAKGAYDGALAVDSAGRPWAAWAHNGRPAQVRQWDGERWTLVGELPGQSVVGHSPDLELGTRDRPWLLWFGPSANREVDLKLAWFDGSTWQQVGDSWWLGCDANIGAAAPVEAALELDSSGRPVVAWITRGVGGVGRSGSKAKAKAKVDTSFEPPALNVCRWDGRAWIALPPPAQGRRIRVSDARRAQLALSALDGPVVAWSEDGEGARDVRASRWDGARWQPLGDREGAVSDCEGACWSPAMALEKGERCLAWEEMADRGRSISVRCQVSEP